MTHIKFELYFPYNYISTARVFTRKLENTKPRTFVDNTEKTTRVTADKNSQTTYVQWYFSVLLKRLFN